MPFGFIAHILSLENSHVQRQKRSETIYELCKHHPVNAVAAYKGVDPTAGRQQGQGVSGQLGGDESTAAAIAHHQQRGAGNSFGQISPGVGRIGDCFGVVRAHR